MEVKNDFRGATGFFDRAGDHVSFIPAFR